MLLRLFRSQEPFNLIVLLLIAIGMRLPYMLDAQPIPYFNYTEPFSIFIFQNYAGLWTYKLGNILITATFYFGLALWFNKIVNDYSLLHKTTMIPSLVFVLLTGIFPTFFTLDAAILALFLQLWVITKLFGFYKTQQATLISFDIGILVALASLLYFPTVAWILLVWVSLLIFRPFYWREWLATVIGFLTPYLFVAFYYFWTNRWEDFLLIWKPLKGSFWVINVFPNRADYLPLLPVLIVLLIGSNQLRANFYKSVLQVRKSQQILIVSIFVTAFSFYIKPGFSINHFILLAAPLSFFLSYYFLTAKKTWFAEILLLLILLSSILFQVV